MLEKPPSNPRVDAKNDATMLAENSTRLYEEAAHIWKDIVGQDRSVPEGTLSSRQLDAFVSRTDIPEPELKAALFLNKNFDYLSSIDGTNHSLSRADVDIFCKSLNQNLKIEPYYTSGNGDRNSARLWGSGIGFGVSLVVAAVLAPAEIPLAGLAIGCTAVGAALFVGGDYIAKKLYESAHPPSEYYGQRRYESSRNGALQALTKLY